MSGIDFDPKLLENTLILEDRLDDQMQSQRLIWPAKWPNVSEEKRQYNMLNGDTLGDLYKKIKSKIPGDGNASSEVGDSEIESHLE